MHKHVYIYSYMPIHIYVYNTCIYKVMYESACAPLERNGDTFYQVLKTGEIQESKPLLSNVTLTRKDETSMSNVLHVTLPDIGHTQLLDNRRGSAIASVCVGNVSVLFLFLLTLYLPFLFSFTHAYLGWGLYVLRTCKLNFVTLLVVICLIKHHHQHQVMRK
jgi:hypothetical protein